MTAWEYKIVRLFTDGDKLIELLNGYGNNGWELITVTAPSQGANGLFDPVAFFKRPK